MSRAPFKPVELSERLQPIAAPVNTFVRAQEPSRDTNLQDLARSLASLGGSLGGLVGKRDREAEEADFIRGKAQFWQDNPDGAASGVSQGMIPAQASPAFMRGYKQMQGTVAGGVLQEKFSAAYDAWPEKGSTDPAAYSTSLGRFLKDNIGTNDPDVLRGLEPAVEQLRSNYLHRHISDASKATMTGAVTALAARQDRALTDANSAGLAAKQGTDYAGVFSQLEQIRAEGLKLGMNEAEVDQKLVSTIVSRAVDLRDPKLLDFLSRRVPGKDYSWDSTPYGREQRQVTLEKLESMGRRSIADDERRRKDELKAARSAITSDTIAAILKDPSAPFSEELLARGEKLDPEFRLNVIRWRDTAGKEAGTSDRQQMLGVAEDILNGGGLNRVERAMRDGVFRNHQDLKWARDLAESMRKDGPKIEAVFSSDQSKAIERTIRERTLTENDATKFVDPDGMSDTGLAAKHDYRMAILAWRTAHPEAGALEQQKAIAEIGAGILGRLSINETGGAAFDRKGLEGTNPFQAGAPSIGAPEAAPAAQPSVTPAKPAQAPAAPPLPLGNEIGEVPAQAPAEAASAQPALLPAQPAPTPAPAQPVAPPKAPSSVSTAANPGDWFNEQPAATKAFIERKAAEEKTPLSLKVQELYGRAIERGFVKPAETAPAPGKRSSMQAPDGTPIETVSTTATDDIEKSFREAIDAPATADQLKQLGAAFEQALAGASKGGRPAVGGYVSAKLRDDPKAARILDFVAGPESGGNYSAYFGHGDSTRDLSGMTLDEVVRWSQNRGTKSSATGRYQFMAGTLKDLKGSMGLSGSERFTPELQDRLALQLLERRGYSDWRAGRITDAEFGNRLALEWASLPNITAQNNRPAGVSAYAGDGLNRSLVSPARVLATLRSSNREPGSTSTTPGFLGRLFGRGKTKPASRPGEGETGV